jgi:hypothetical protein
VQRALVREFDEKVVQKCMLVMSNVAPSIGAFGVVVAISMYQQMP